MKKIYIRIQHNNYIKYSLLEILFVMLTIFVSWIYLKSNTLELNGNSIVPVDGLYHIQEAKEITADLSHGIIPAFNHFYGIKGLALATFYPWISFIVIIMGIVLHISISFSIKCSYVCTLLIIYNICFWSAKKYWHKNLEALLFTCLVTATLNMFDFTYTNDFAQSLATPFIVMGIFGWLSLMKYSHWKMLATSIIVLMYIHFVSTYAIIITLILLTLVASAKLNKRIIISGIKAIITTILATSIIWIPLVILRFNNQIYTPIGHFIQDNANTNSFGLQTIPALYFILALIVILNIKKIDWIQWSILLVSILLMCIALIISPSIIQHTIIFIPIQYAYKIGPTSFILISILSTPFIYKYVKYHANFIIQCILWMCILMFIILPISLNNKLMNQSDRINDIQNTKKEYKDEYITKTITKWHKYNFLHNINKDTLYTNNYYLDEFMPRATQQFYGKRNVKSLAPTTHTQSYIPNILMQQNMYINHMHNIYNGISTSSKKAKYNIILPIITYKGQNYKFYLNNKRFKPYKYVHHEPVIHYLPRGNNKITFEAPFMWYRYLSILIALSSLIILIPTKKETKYENKKYYHKH